jgi:putative ABC transport system permease protein
MFQPADADVILAVDTATLPIEVGAKLEKFSYIKSTAPVVVIFIAKEVTMIYGIEPESFARVSGGFVFKKGRIFQAHDEVVVDDIFAKDKKVDIGSEIKLKGRMYKISGIVENGKGARIFMGLDEAQDVNSSKGLVTVFFIKLKDSSDIDGAIKILDMDVPGYELRNVPKYAELMSGANIPGFDAFNRAVVFIALCIGVLVIFLSMYTTIMERTREIGILRSLGASKSYIVIIIMKEALFLCSVGVVLGTIASFGIIRVAQTFFPTLAFDMSWQWMVNAAISALASGIIGSIHPSMKAASQDPVEAFAYE